MAVPAVNGTNSTGSHASGATSLTISHTVGASLSNSLLIVMHSGISQHATGATWNGTAMTLAKQGDGGQYFNTIWYLVAPEAGTLNVIISFASQTRSNGGVITLTGARQTSPIDQTFDANGNTGTSVSDTLTSTEADTLVMDVVMGNSSTAFGVGADQIEQTTINNSERMATSTENAATIGTYTMSWTKSDASAHQHTGINVRAPAAAAVAKIQSNLLLMNVG